MGENLLLRNHVSERVFLLDDIHKITIIFDKSFANFGTKLRKARGILNHLYQNEYSGVFLTGDPNSNYMAAFSTFFYLSGLKVHSIFYNQSGYKNINYYISEKHSHKITWVKSKLDISNTLMSLNSPHLYLVPNYGMTKEALNGIESLWEKINFQNYSHFALEIGSGLTFLSLLDYIKKKEIKNIKVIGIAIGLRTEKLIMYLNNISSLFLRNEFDFSTFEIIEPVKYPGFGKTGQDLWDFCTLMAKKGLFVEPIYSGKSLLSLSEYLSKTQEIDRLAYLHQGGLPPSITRFQL